MGNIFTKKVIKEYHVLLRLADTIIKQKSQNDGYDFCECPDCKALDEKEGSQSGTVIHFVNQII